MNSFRIKAVDGDAFFVYAEFETPHEFAEHLRSNGFAICTRYQAGKSGPVAEREIALMASFVGTIEVGGAT